MSALSNRQRRLQRKATPKVAREHAPALVIPMEPKPDGPSVKDGVQAQQALLSQAALMQDANTEAVVGETGPVHLPSAIAAEFSIDQHFDRTTTGLPYRVGGRDGVVALYKSKALTADQAKAALAYRLVYRELAKGLGSCLGRVGEGRGAPTWGDVKIGVDEKGELAVARTAAELHRTYLRVRLNQMEAAVGVVLTDGRELHALRRIAGEGETVREMAGSSGHARAATVAALARALDAIAKALRITGQ